MKQIYTTGVTTQPLHAYQKSDQGNITTTFTGTVEITSPKEISDEAVPAPVKHVFEIWADPECTTRPTEANCVYVQVNKDLTLDDVAMYGSDKAVDADFEFWEEDGVWGLSFQFDFILEGGMLRSAPKKGDVIKLKYGSESTLNVSNGPFSFGEIVEE